MIAELAKQLDQEEVEAARRMPLADKALLGEILFHRAVEVTRAGIRFQFPDASEQQVASILEERLQWRERQEQSS